MKGYREQKHFHGEPLQNLIAKFHGVASQGPPVYLYLLQPIMV